MINVCFVSPTYYLNTVGGAEIQLHMMATGLAGLEGCRVSYVTPDARESVESGGIRVVSIPSPDGKRECGFDEFTRTLDSMSPDIVIQLGRKQFTAHAARYCARRDTRFLFSAASDIDCRRFREFPRYFGEFPLRRWRNPVRAARALATDLKTFAGMKSADLVVAQTQTQQHKLRRLLGREIPLFQNLHHVPEDSSIVKQEPSMVLWLASIKPVKRPRLFLEICRHVRSCGCRVVMAGRMNDESFREEIEAGRKAGDLEYIENVTFDQSNELISQARVFVMTSHHEGLPNTLIQAWLRRTPTVSLGVDPDRMISANGLGVHVDSVEQAVEAVSSLLEDRDRCEAMGAAARRFAIERFGIESQSLRLKELIDRTLDDD